MKILPVLEAYSLQDRCNFGMLELSIFVVKITASVFDFNSSGRLGEKTFWTNVMSKGQKEGDGRGRGNAFLARQISSTSRLYKIPLPS